MENNQGEGARRRIFLNTEGAAQVLGQTVRWLEADRIGKQLVPFYKIGGAVKYELRELHEFLESCKRGGAGSGE